MNTYEKAVAANLAHMQTSLVEWQAVEITGFSDATDDKGNSVKMPTFEFPAGYSPAPTLYKAQAAACCELCAHDIKNVYWLQNDSKRWLLAVGSECVTKFADGKSGDQLADEVRREQNRNLVVALIEAAKALRHCFCYRASIGYGRTQEAWTLSQARMNYKMILKLLGKIESDSTDGAISGFITRKGVEARAMLESFNDWQAVASVVAAGISGLKAKASVQNNIVVLRRCNGQAAADWQVEDAKRQLESLNADIARMTAEKCLCKLKLAQ